ncbi:MAG: response regulator [Chloroflexota bacterium]|jgi:DNA-binding response OmpR family regulator
MAKPSVLIVEDDTAMADTLASMIHLLGYRSRVVHSSRAAISAATKERPDLILLDLNLPGINGFEVCRYLKRDPQLSNTQVIFVSVEGGSDRMQLAREAGAAAYLIKPVGLDELEETIAEVLQSAEEG